MAGGARAAEVAATAAADASADSTAEAESSVTEVVVTARHRVENIQKVPVAVSVVGADLLKKTNTSDIAQISAASATMLAWPTTASSPASVSTSTKSITIVRRPRRST